MEEEEEDRVLLSSLGVTSANPEDIERDILAKVVNVYHTRFVFVIVNILFIYFLFFIGYGVDCICCSKVDSHSLSIVFRPLLGYVFLVGYCRWLHNFVNTKFGLKLLTVDGVC